MSVNPVTAFRSAAREQAFTINERAASALRQFESDDPFPYIVNLILPKRFNPLSKMDRSNPSHMSFDILIIFNIS